MARAERLPAADSVAARAEIVRAVGEIVSELPDPFREALLLRFWEGLPPRRIADRLGVPVATVRSRTRRALQRVRRELERRAPADRWREALALAVGLLPQRGMGRAAMTTTSLGAAVMKTSSWIAGAWVLFGVALTAAVGLSALRSNVTGAGSGRGVSRSSSELEPLAREHMVARRRPREPLGSTAPAVVETLERLRVRVVGPSGKPVTEAELLGGETSTSLHVVANTDAQGHASVDRTPELRVLCARAGGWAPSAVYDVPETARANEPLVLQLPLRGATLTVLVRDPRGAPLPGASVFAGRQEEVEYRAPDGTLARTAPGFHATTDSGGLARFASLAPGWLRVTAEHGDYADATRFTTLETYRDNRLELSLAHGLFLEGRVRDEDGAPVPGARIQRGSGPRSTTSAADGSYPPRPGERGQGRGGRAPREARRMARERCLGGSDPVGPGPALGPGPSRDGRRRRREAARGLVGPRQPRYVAGLALGRADRRAWTLLDPRSTRRSAARRGAPG